ncbi:hypothetical protein GOP47_0008347 [Adiantum capillus-veneris]|uniref:TIR domain-containing protein n=1 Tax=Adiantum capillus-veneris TaxID=13818 RepID=A0A9D4ZJL2_ADICA|nr:hypothetical protein GOP47_0008347 [Adiantum capillus-veneris]
MAASSSTSSQNITSCSPYDVFLAHSGVQKGFVKGLHMMLPLVYSTFFDIDQDSLPLAEPFPPRIIKAAKTCKLAVVVLSHEFITSKWPMFELHTFHQNKVKILPLFFNITPPELQDPQSAREKWKGRFAGDRHINVGNWEEAVAAVRPINGLVFDPQDGEVIFTNKVVDEIAKILRPQNITVDSLERAVRMIKQANKDHAMTQKLDLDLSINLKAVIYIRDKVNGVDKKAEAATKLVHLKVIPELVDILKNVNQDNTMLMRQAGWALKHVVHYAGNSAKEDAVKVGVIEVLLRMLDYEQTIACAIFCMSTLIQVNIAKTKLRNLNEGGNTVHSKLCSAYQKFDRISDSVKIFHQLCKFTKTILGKMKWTPP